ncbi:hypothetical protein [Aliamphritea spongicola]|nr:hypothetical protein [Aliamphritea spongicola]
MKKLLTALLALGISFGVSAETWKFASEEDKKTFRIFSRKPLLTPSRKNLTATSALRFITTASWAPKTISLS